MHSWDLYIQDSLTHVFLGTLESQLVILLILDSEPFGRYLTEALNGPQLLLLSQLSKLFCDRHSKRTSLLAEFSSNPSRSGPFYLDGDKYATIAINFKKYLITEMYVCESVKYIFTSRSYLLVNTVHILRPSSILYLNATCLLYPFYCHRHHVQ